MAYYRGIVWLALGDSVRAMPRFRPGRASPGLLREVASLLGMPRGTLISTGRANHLRRWPIEAARSAKSPEAATGEMAALAAWNDSSMVSTNWSWGFLDPAELVPALDDRYERPVARFVRACHGAARTPR